MYLLQLQGINQIWKVKGIIKNYKFRQVTIAEAEKFCQENKLSFIEASAKTGENINKIFEVITSSLFESHHLSCNKEKDRTIILDPDFKTTQDKKKKKCCK